MNQVLFALNETYWMNEKGAAAIADSFSTVPSRYAQRVNAIITLVTEDQTGLEKALETLHELIQETEHLVKMKGVLN